MSDDPFYLTLFSSHTLNSLDKLGLLTNDLQSDIEELAYISFVEMMQFDWNHNDRTKDKAWKAGDGVVGSFNISNTSMNVSEGTTVPGKQLIDDHARALQTRVVQLNHRIILATGRSMMSKIEWELIAHNSIVCNVVQLGEEPSGPTSIQYNVSKLGDLLMQNLGIQGRWHVDNKDDPTRFTFVHIFLNIGEGKAHMYLCLVVHEC
jgi:hypothetical protein